MTLVLCRLFTDPPLLAAFPYPPMLYSLLLFHSLSAPSPTTPPPHPSLPLLFTFPTTPPLRSSSHPLSLPLLASLCSGPIGSHYIDGNDDSVEWCTLSPVPLRGLSLQPVHAAAAAVFSSDRSLTSFCPWHLLLSVVTS